MQDIQETLGQSLGQEDPLEKEMATHSSILSWETPWTLAWAHMYNVLSRARLYCYCPFALIFTEPRPPPSTSLIVQWTNNSLVKESLALWTLSQNFRSAMYTLVLIIIQGIHYSQWKLTKYSSNTCFEAWSSKLSFQSANGKLEAEAEVFLWTPEITA